MSDNWHHDFSRYNPSSSSHAFEPSCMVNRFFFWAFVILFYVYTIVCFRKRQSKQWWSTNPPISTKWTIISHLNPLNIIPTTTYDVRTPDSSLGQTQRCGRVKSSNWAPNPFPLIIRPLTANKYKQTIKTPHIFVSRQKKYVKKMNDNINMDSTMAEPMNTRS